MTDIVITGSPATSDSTEPTDLEMLVAIKLHIKGQLDDGGVQDYSLAGKRLSKYTLTELLPLLKYYESRVARVSTGTNGITYAGGNRRS